MHLTVRMAWHDRGWDGKICDDPSANTYCTGTHSLLSDRIAREKRIDLEKPKANLDAAVAVQGPNDLNTPVWWDK